MVVVSIVVNPDEVMPLQLSDNVSCSVGVSLKSATGPVFDAGLQAASFAHNMNPLQDLETRCSRSEEADITKCAEEKVRLRHHHITSFWHE